MVNHYSEFLKSRSKFPESSSTEGTSQEKDGKGEKKKVNANIWKINPSFNDINSLRTNLQASFVVGMDLFYGIFLYFLWGNWALSFGLSFLIMGFFVLVFHHNFFRLQHLFQYRSYDPFKDLIFWQSKQDPSVLFLTNQRDLITTGVRMFQVTVLPENVHATLESFVKGLSKDKIPYTYQVLQAPIKEGKQIESHSYEYLIYFAIYYDVSGKLTYTKLIKLIDTLQTFTHQFKHNLTSNFHHFKVPPLLGIELIDAFRSSLLRKSIPFSSMEVVDPKTRDSIISLVSRVLVILFLIISTDVILGSFSYPMILRLGVNGLLTGMLISLWWRNIFHLVRIKKKIFLKDITYLNPFADISFFRMIRFPETLFYRTEHRTVGGIKMLNLKFVHTPAYGFPTKFYHALVEAKMPYTITSLSTPLMFYRFSKEGKKELQPTIRQQLNTYLTNEIDAENWLLMRSGIWKTILTLSTNYFCTEESFHKEELLSIEMELCMRLDVLKNAFKTYYFGFETDLLQKNKLEAGLLCELCKIKSYRLNGTHLTYVLMQGTTLVSLTLIADEFKKGIETRIAAEFNTPLQLKNDVILGYTLNTEFLKQEIPFGFTLRQLHHLLITNGTVASRENLAMKMVMELIKLDEPSLIFDFTGNWSKLLRLFKDSQYEKKFWYFKLARTFEIDPLYSEIPFDEDNVSYLDYMFDVYAMCFKKDERTMEMFANTIQRNASQGHSVSTVNLDLISRPDWQKSPITNTVLNFFSEFTQQEETFFHSTEKRDQKGLHPHEFVTNDKTIILDLSQSRDFQKQCFFSFIILAKILHYLSKEQKYTPKFLFIPHLDIIFDGFYLDKNIRYGKIDKFLNSLLQKGFGLVLSCNQAHYLHPNVFNYLENVVTFKATDTRDIAVLKNQMGLEQLHGVGYYSRSRNEPYQTRYLMAMKPNEALVKRSDLYQPFPIEVMDNDLKETTPFSWDEIVSYMNTQGFDLEYTERKILERAKKTLLEKDFGDYALLVPEIIHLLESLKTVDQIGNLYANRVKDELKKAIYPKLSKITKDKKRIKEMRDEIFSLLLQQHYLAENHPKKASGSESIRTSYSVGQKFEEALDDYYTTRRNALTDVEFGVVSQESNLDNNLAENSKIQQQQEQRVKEALAKVMGDTLQWDLYQMFKYQARKDFRVCLQIAVNFLPRFLDTLYHHYYQPQYLLTSKDIETFIDFLSKQERFPFTKDQLKAFITEAKKISLEEESLERLCDIWYKKCADIETKVKNYVYTSGE